MTDQKAFCEKQLLEIYMCYSLMLLHIAGIGVHVAEERRWGRCRDGDGLSRDGVELGQNPSLGTSFCWTYRRCDIY